MNSRGLGKEELTRFSGTPVVKEATVNKDIKTEEQLQRHLEQGGVEWRRLGDFLHDLEQACVDGRDPNHVIGIPGGDMGTLVLKIAVAEEMLGKQFEISELKAIFKKYVTEFGKFYMHSDQHALQHLAQSLNSNHAELFPTNALSDLSQLELIVRDPENEEQKAALLTELVNPDNMGCGHLNRMLKNLQQYGARDGVLQALVEAFFEELWDGQNADFVILQGDHKEKYILRVHVEGELDEDSLVPAIKPLNQETSTEDELDEVFVYHPEVIDAILRLQAGYMGDDMIPGLDLTNELVAREFIEKVQKLGVNQLLATISHLAPDKEIWDTTVSEQDGNTVVSRPVRAA